MHYSSFKNVSPIEWPRAKAQLIHFVRKHSGKRITHESFRCLSSLTAEQLLLPENSVFVATVRGQEGPELIGLSFMADFGESACIVVVHPLYRGYGIGKQLLTSQLNQAGRISCRVATDNLPSLNMCIQAGLQAGELVYGPTGKPTLQFQGSKASSAPTTRKARR